MEIDPAVLRQLASQHDQVARDTREWAKPPADWLANFLPTYGKIAFPVYEALEKYYDARQRAGDALAGEHERTRDSLLASAEAYEDADDEFGSQIRQAGGLIDGSPLPVAPAGPSSDSPGPDGSTPPFTPPPGGPPGGPTAVGPDGTQNNNPLGTTPGESNGATPSSTATPSGPVTAPTDSSGGAPNATGTTSTSTGPSSTGVTAPAGTGVPPTGAGPLYSSADDRGSAQPPSGATGRPDLPPMPLPVTTPFGAAVAAAKDKEAEPAYVVGGQVNDDLVLAKTLLGSVLAAVDSPVGMAWSVAVLRGPGGVGVFITSNEGRGWLPAGLYLPREVSTPWNWDELLTEGDGSGSPWEGVTDPARVLAEFGLAWGAKANAQLSALVSSGSIDPGLRSRFSDAAMEGLVGPSYDVDLREFTPDTADRLGLTGSIAALEHVSAVPDAQVRSRCTELAADAHAQVGRSGPVPAEAAASRQVRERILAALQAGRPVASELWNELRDADDLLAASMLGQRVDVGRVEIGQLRVDAGLSPLRSMVFERRCNELVLLLADESSRQTLRDAVYAHEQITQHPQFVSTPAPVSTATQPERVARPTVPAVTAPDVVAGPPPTSVVAPSTPPPVAPPERS
ncbi:type VII secretion target [Nocardia sp. NBC_00508]|uniref:type VII secretion target n=1 Tax=Nocardia sp. NBC_00508 TaxID=2975992 RepID=UPI002E81A9DC|nr:type VII secretion target [Nocardia sp. NBC_00508]WUD68138.1 type VII secretion target [Nocardia sp. NBC_00508]